MSDEPGQSNEPDEILDALEEATADPPKGVRTGRTGGRIPWLPIVGALVALALAVTAVHQWRRADEATSAARDRTAAERVASEFGETLFTFVPTNPTGSLDRLKQLATTAYQAKVEDARRTAVAAGTSGQATSSMTNKVLDVYLTDLGADRARAVTRSDLVLKVSGETAHIDLYLQYELRKVKGEWRVDTVNALTTKAPQGLTATTSTTVPASPSTTGRTP
jgi:hypothetical protein